MLAFLSMVRWRCSTDAMRVKAACSMQGTDHMPAQEETWDTTGQDVQVACHTAGGMFNKRLKRSSTCAGRVRTEILHIIPNEPVLRLFKEQRIVLGVDMVRA